MHRFCTLLNILVVLFVAFSQAQTKVQPAIAMHCNKNTQHLDLETGRWVTDPSGDSDCLEDDNEILDYCRKIYPSLSITSISRKSDPVKIKSWCSRGHTGPICKGHSHVVKPVKCLSVKPGCSLETLSDKCQDSSYWLAKAQQVCQSNEKVFGTSYRTIKPCSGGNSYQGVEFTCCENNKPVKKIVPSNDPCSLPRATGPCRAAFNKWYFDTDTGSCKMFIYGGCGGNENKFQNKEDCEKKCDAPADLDSVKQPLIAMQHSLVIPPKPEGESEEQTQSSESYFSSPLSSTDEQHLYSSALLNEVKEHKSKLATIMSQWSSAKTDLFHRGASPEEKQKLDDDLQATVDALKSEHQKKKKQLVSAHQARMDAAIVGAREDSYNSFLDKLNDPSTKNKQLLNAFKHYLQAEKRDQHHTNLQLKSNNIDEETSQSLQNKLQTIKSRVNNAVQLAQQRVGQSETLKQMNDMMSDMFGSELDVTTTASPPTDDLTEDEKPILIDHGGLAPENTEFREPSFSDVYDGFDDNNDDSDDDDEEYDDSDDEYDDDMMDEADEFSDVTPPPLLPSDFDMNDNVDPLFSNNYFDENEINDDDDDDEDDFNEDDLPSPDFLVNPVNNYNERWLIWVGVAGVVIIVAVVGVAAVYFSRSRRYKRQQFARVEIDDHLTPEERQLLQMQQNGYENPTYKFFEKQKV